MLFSFDNDDCIGLNINKAIDQFIDINVTITKFHCNLN